MPSKKIAKKVPAKKTIAAKSRCKAKSKVPSVKKSRAVRATLYVLPVGKALILRTCRADLSSRGGFLWPRTGHVEAPDWSPVAECGKGLHGALWGEGDGNLFHWDADAAWLVVEVAADRIVDLGGKVKFPEGNVIFTGDRKAATDLIYAHAPGSRAVIGGMPTSGWGGTSISGKGGTSTSGWGGTSTSGWGGTSTSGDYGTSTSGYRGTSTSGDYGTSTSGVGGTSTSGDRGTSTSGDHGTSTSGVGGTSTSGVGGTLVLKWWDGRRYRLVNAYVGEDGIEVGVGYGLDEKGKVVKREKIA